MLLELKYCSYDSVEWKLVGTHTVGMCVGRLKTTVDFQPNRYIIVEYDIITYNNIIIKTKLKTTRICNDISFAKYCKQKTCHRQEVRPSVSPVGTSRGRR